MRYLLLLLLAALHFFARAQTDIHMVLVTHRPIDQVQALDMDRGGNHFSSPYQDTVTFSFKKGSINLYELSYEEGDKVYSMQLWLNPGDVTVMAHIENDALLVDTVMGAPIYYVAADYQKTYARLLKANDTDAINHFLLQAYEENIDNLFSYTIGLDYLGRNQNSPAALSRLQALVDRQGNSLDGSFLYTSMTGSLSRRLHIRDIRIGDFTFSDRDGRSASISFSGADTYILDLWTLSPRCTREHNEIKPLLSILEARHIQLIGISVDLGDVSDLWKTYLTENDYTWPNYRQRGDHPIARYLAYPAYPTYVVLDGKGTIKGSYNTFSDVLKGLGLTKP
jgi:hypothetical protein